MDACSRYTLCTVSRHDMPGKVIELLQEQVPGTHISVAEPLHQIQGLRACSAHVTQPLLHFLLPVACDDGHRGCIR